MITEFRGISYPVKFWKGEKLGRTLAVDTETTIAPFTETPECVTVQLFDGSSVYYLTKEAFVENFMTNERYSFIFHNAVFDMDVIDLNVMAWDSRLEKELVWDTMLLFRLWHLGTQGYVPGKSSLAYVTNAFLEVELDKDDEIRMGFGQFVNQPLETIPEKYLTYGAMDVIATFQIYQILMSRIACLGSSTTLTHQIQLCGAYALNKIYKNGINVDGERAAEIDHELALNMSKEQDILACYGWIRGQKGCNERYESIVKDLKLVLPFTKDNSISSASEDLLPYKDNHFVSSYLKFNELEKQRTFVKGLVYETKVHPRYNAILNTGRTSCSKPNFQQLPKAGEIRSLFKAEPGNTFIITDYSAIELVTLAQTTYKMFGFSKMRDMINDGKDLHIYYASVLHEIEESEVTKQQRQEAKAANFGFPGGLGIDTFIQFSKGYDLILSVEQAREMKKAWFTAFPEMELYMQFEEKDDAAWTLSRRKRSRASYCARKNTPFQGLAADGAKIALYNLVKDGFKLRGFIHDEIVSEVRIERAEELVRLQEKIMIESMRVVCPDVDVRVETTISERYCK